jgi:type IV pilus assembly protein PilW
MRAELRLSRSRQLGLSLVELMVGLTVGLFIVAGAVMLATSQLSENRRVLLETQVQQDLRATADIIARDLRRAGRQSDETALRNVAQWSQPFPPAQNVLAAIDINAGEDDVRYRYLQPTGVTQAGFQFDAAEGRIRMLVGPAAWQDLTDPNALEITRFQVQQFDGPAAALRLPCPRLCPPPGGPEDCWPTLQVRELRVTIAGRARSDPSVQHEVSTGVRLRNDVLSFNGGAGAGVCP